eukprot:CAMPEP_0178704662 /NCGR_PEP_ID=MMETSP0699-20121125/14327_1 /TAXON_ID=265572 /ORGANISM="Extubocellulus spinifer, Strain CCMP396" /LENGTH=148 /DNA_ID=CAMNT_0020352079 /DNA_START=55 /DNA_END=499 /DNA_ORIENTATION=-
MKDASGVSSCTVRRVLSRLRLMQMHHLTHQTCGGSSTTCGTTPSTCTAIAVRRTPVEHVDLGPDPGEGGREALLDPAPAPSSSATWLLPFATAAAASSIGTVSRARHAAAFVILTTAVRGGGGWSLSVAVVVVGVIAADVAAAAVPPA